MEQKVQISELLPFMEEAFSRGKSFTLPITGTSMLPLLVAGRDTVTLQKPVLPLQKGELPLYRRSDGSFVLHRVVRVRDGLYTMCGDNQFLTEKGICGDQIIGVVSAVHRNGKDFSVLEKKYNRYVRFWTAVLPLRYPVRRMKFFLHRMKAGKKYGK